ncbi:MAG: RNA chaperone Hfq [Mesorhizobium sp.]|nr:MAG: RNA chaperone Hfq [Mesorhizobium sp.]
MCQLIWRIGLQNEGDRRKTRTMAERSQNLQDLFLNSVRKSKNPLTIFLINGVKLTGVVTSFDNFCVLLRRDGHSQLVYKHAISTIMPSQPVQMFDGEESQGA